MWWNTLDYKWVLLKMNSSLIIILEGESSCNSCKDIGSMCYQLPRENSNVKRKCLQKENENICNLNPWALPVWYFRTTMEESQFFQKHILVNMENFCTWHIVSLAAYPFLYSLKPDLCIWRIQSIECYARQGDQNIDNNKIYI